jgi:hypothetical protein
VGPADRIGHTHRSPIMRFYRELNSTLRPRIGQIDDNEMTSLFAMDVPSDKIQMALVVRPSYPFA